MRGSGALRRWVACAAAAAAALGVTVTVAAGTDDAAEVAVGAERLDRGTRALVVSDSAWLGLRLAGAIDAVRGTSHVLDLASCRRRVIRSCRNYDGSVPITLLDELEVHGDAFHTLVVATGYNDSDGAFADEVDRIVDRARGLGYRRVVWLTLRSNVSYGSPGGAGYGPVYAANNATLASIVAAGTHPELVVADWARYSRDRPQWFATDGVHLGRTGAWAAADYLSRKLAHLDGRPCPWPAAVDVAPTAPCPDPDAGPPEVDLASLYPIGRPNPTAVFELEYEGSGSWPAPPFWER